MGYSFTVGVTVACLVGSALVGCDGSNDVTLDAGSTGDAAVDATDASPTVDAPACNGNQVTCSGTCVDTTTDPRHCGDCATSCGAGEACLASKCTCAGTVCNGKCTDVMTDPLNCGQCIKPVCHGETCVAGKPSCAPGLKACGGSVSCLGCEELGVDPANCGSCGTACLPNQVCTAPPKMGAKCTYGVCDVGLAACPSNGSTSCADLTSDLENCGGCGNTCSPGEFCVNSACVGYSSGVGCTTCPCATCTTLKESCCTYASAPVCTTAAKCP